MITIKTPTRTVEITMTEATAEGYDGGICYASDYIGNLVGGDGGASGLTRATAPTGAQNTLGTATTRRRIGGLSIAGRPKATLIACNR